MNKKGVVGVKEKRKRCIRGTEKENEEEGVEININKQRGWSKRKSITGSKRI